ncbi:hypothetical protein [Kutzneria buriramensis]|uniref:Uncharacterized protein n=1 Tax=Kutzneria buriramensis TaxID=1045776 RepID=A0A3E0GXX4_9PSEU|nr:hypothetical protein [Kutzneria buriramensis]REH33058.1 hypothetical protein BCF44_120130 [Kutzneria buriramensis]
MDLMRFFRREAREAEIGAFHAVETKVKAASTTALVTSFVMDLAARYVFPNGVPGWATALISGAVVGGLTFAAGWLAKHTPREPTTPAAPAPAPEKA